MPDYGPTSPDFVATTRMSSFRGLESPCSTCWCGWRYVVASKRDWAGTWASTSMPRHVPQFDPFQHHPIDIIGAFRTSLHCGVLTADACEGQVRGVRVHPFGNLGALGMRGMSNTLLLEWNCLFSPSHQQHHCNSNLDSVRGPALSIAFRHGNPFDTMDFRHALSWLGVLLLLTLLRKEFASLALVWCCVALLPVVLGRQQGQRPSVSQQPGSKDAVSGSSSRVAAAADRAAGAHATQGGHGWPLPGVCALSQHCLLHEDSLKHVYAVVYLHEPVEHDS